MSFNLNDYAKEKKRNETEETADGVSAEKSGAFSLNEYAKSRESDENVDENVYIDRINSWQKNISDFADAYSDEYAKRDGLYKSDFGSYEDSTVKRADELIAEARALEKYFSGKGDTYKDALDALSANSDYLWNVKSALAEERTYRDKFADEDSWNTNQKYLKWQEMPKSENFDIDSEYVSPGTHDAWYGKGIYNDTLYEIINGTLNDENYKDYSGYSGRYSTGTPGFADTRDTGGTTEDLMFAKNLTDDQRKTYNAIYKRDGATAAREYYDAVKTREYSVLESAMYGFAAPTASVMAAASSLFGDDGKAFGSELLKEQMLRKEAHPTAYGVGEVAGNIAETVAMGNLVSGIASAATTKVASSLISAASKVAAKTGTGAVSYATKAALTKAASIGVNAITSPMIFALKTAVNESGYLAYGYISPDEFGNHILRSGAAGAASSLAGSLTSLGLEKVFVSAQLQTGFAEYVRNLFSSTASSAAYGLTDYAVADEKPSSEEMWKNLAISFAFSTVTSYMQTFRTTSAAAESIGKRYDQISEKFSALEKATSGRKYTEEGATEILTAVAEECDDLIGELTNTYYAGQQKFVSEMLESLQALRDSVGLRLSGFTGSASASGTASSGFVNAIASAVADGIESGIQAAEPNGTVKAIGGLTKTPADTEINTGAVAANAVGSTQNAVGIAASAPVVKQSVPSAAAVGNIPSQTITKGEQTGTGEVSKIAPEKGEDGIKRLASKYDSAGKKAMIENYDGGDAVQYAKDFNAYYEAGRQGKPVTSHVSLTDSQAEAAFKAGMKDAKNSLASDVAKGYNKEKTNAEFFAEASDEQKLFPSGNRNPESYKYVTVSEGVDGDVQFRFYNNQKLAERNMQIYSATTGNKIELVKVGESGSVSQAVNTIFGGNYGKQENAYYGEGRIRNFAQRSGGSVEGIYGASEETGRNDNFRRNDRKIFEASSRNVQGKELISEATDADIRISDGVSEKSSALAKKNGAKAISFEGELRLEDGGIAEGFYNPVTDTIGAQINNAEFEQADLIRHEIMERKIAHGEVRVEDAVARARQFLDDPTLLDSCAEYLAAHYCAKDASELTADEIAAATKELVCDGADHLNRLRYVVDNGYVSAKTRETADAFDLVLDALNRANRELTGGAFDVDGELTSIQQTAEQNLAELGITVADDAALGSEFSTRFTLTEEEQNKAVDDLVDRLGVTKEEAKNWVKSETSLSALILQNPDTMDFEADDRYTAIKKNSDYPQGTFDLNNLCIKRAPMTDIAFRLQHEYPNRVFTAQDMETIRQTLIEEKVTVPCGGCFVEDRRQLLGEIAQMYIDALKNGEELKPSVQKALGSGNIYIPTIADLVTYDGLKELWETHPNVAKAFVAYNNARGMQAGRLIEGEAEYKREILKYNKRTVASKNSKGGLRISSFSELNWNHLLDLVQAVSDGARVGLTMQGYTKVPLLSSVIRDTNIKMNQSHIPYKNGWTVKNGKEVLLYDPVEGINYLDKNFIDGADTDNIGNNIIGINEKQIRLAMGDDYISQIIPFHTGLSEEMLIRKKIDHWQNYKNSQTDKDVFTGKTAKKQINFYTDVLKAAEDSGQPIRNRRDFVEKFLAVAKERNLTPRFWEFLNTNSSGDYIFTEGYEKFLVDFKMFDKNGNILPQKPVVPIFNDELLTKIMFDYAESVRTPQFDTDAVYEKVKKNVLGNETHFSKKLNLTEDSDKEVNPVSQEISSAKTSIKQIPALFKDKNVSFGKVNIDIGGGRFDLATEYLAKQGTENLLFDPYNRSEDTNKATLKYLQDGNRADTATCANVLNVIAEKSARLNVILEAAKAIKPDGKAYFTVYEGDGSGNGKVTSAGWQNNLKTAAYIEEISEYFETVERRGKLITASDPLPELPKASWETSPGKAVQFSKKLEFAQDEVSDSKWRTTRIADAKGELKPLSQIIEQMRHDLGFNLTYGHIRGKNILGQFDRIDKGIRARTVNDLPVISHEIGHFLDSKFGIRKGIPKNVAAELHDALGELKDAYDPSKWTTEGLAEFVRMYLRNRDEASVRYPEATKYILGKLDAKSLALIQQFSDECNAYFALDGENAKSSIRLREEKPYDARSFPERIKDTSDTFYQAWIDSNASIKKISEKAYMYATNSAYTDAVAGQIIVGDLTDINGKYVAPGLKTALKGINTRDKAEYADFGEYLVMKHGLEYLAEGKRVFADNTKNNVSFMNRRIAELEKQYPQFKAASERLYRFISDLTKTWGVDLGVISPDAFNEWQKARPCYVPFNRVMDKGKGGIGAKRGFANQGNPYKRAVGSGREIINPVDSVIDNIVKLVNVGTRNNVMQIITNTAEAERLPATILEKIPTPMIRRGMNIGSTKAELLQRIEALLNGNADLIGQVDEIFQNFDDIIYQFSVGKAHGDIVTVLKKGKAEFWKINDPLLLDSVTNMSPAAAHGIVGAMGKITRFMTANITGNNVVWSIFSNAPRDLQTFLTYSKNISNTHGLSKVSEFAKTMKALAAAYIEPFKDRLGKTSPLYREYLALGGGHQSAYSADSDLALNARKQITKNTLQRAIEFLNPINTVSLISDAIEGGPRFATYSLMRNIGLSPQEAFYEAMDVTVNFRKSGVHGRTANKFIPFFNAGLQGTDKLFRFMSADDVKGSSKKKAVIGRLAAFFASAAILATLDYVINNKSEDDKENYQMLSTYTKNNYWCIPLGDGKYFAIPRGRELGVLASLIERSYEATFGENPHAFDDFYNYATDAILPSTVSDVFQLPANIAENGFGEGVEETMYGFLGGIGILGVFANMGANRDFLGRPIESAVLQRREPKDRYTGSTSKLAQLFGQAFNASPQMVDYFGNQVLGYIWQTNQALFPVDDSRRDLTLGVKNKYYKDNLYSTDIINWIYDYSDALSMKKNSSDDIDVAIEAKLASNMTTVWSRYSSAVRDMPESDEKTRNSRRLVQQMFYDFRTAAESGKQTESQKLVTSIVKAENDTELLPSVMNNYIKDADGTIHKLTGSQYYEYQSLYNNYYYTFAERAIKKDMSQLEKERTLKQAKAYAKTKATNEMSYLLNISSEEDKYTDVPDDKVVTFKAQVDIADDDGLEQKEVIEILKSMISDGLSFEDAYTLFHSRYESDKNNPWAIFKK